MTSFRWSIAPGLAALLLTILSAQTSSDLPVIGVIKQSEPSLTRTSILHRTQVAANLDLVIAMASPQPGSGPITWWGKKEQLGLFLQEQSNPDRVYALALAPGFDDCYFRVLRATATDTVVQCTEEKSGHGPNQKFVYDIHAKSLISHFSYQPFSMRRIVPKAGNGALILGPKIAVDFEPDRDPQFRLQSHTEEEWPPAEPKPVSFGNFRLIQGVIVQTNGKQYPLHRPNYEEFAKSRQLRVSDGYKERVEFDDHIGPWALEGGNLWFGKSFYDGEGITGIGGFGYFDTTEKKYHLYAAPEIADYSVSAIHVDPEAVWMALVHNGEWGGSSGGLLRFDRTTNAIRKFEMPDIGRQFRSAGDRLLLATTSGFAVIVNDQITRYFIDKTTDGRLRVAQE